MWSSPVPVCRGTRVFPFVLSPPSGLACFCIHYFCPSTSLLAPYSYTVWTGTNPPVWDDSLWQEGPREQDLLWHWRDLHLPSAICDDGGSEGGVHRQWHLDRDSRMQMYKGARKVEASVNSACCWSGVRFHVTVDDWKWVPVTFSQTCSPCPSWNCCTYSGDLPSTRGHRKRLCVRRRPETVRLHGDSGVRLPRRLCAGRKLSKRLPGGRKVVCETILQWWVYILGQNSCRSSVVLFRSFSLSSFLTDSLWFHSSL